MATVSEQARLKEARQRENRISAIAAALRAGGMEAARAQKAAEAGVEATTTMSKNASTFPIRKWGVAFAKAAGAGWLDDPEWGKFRGLIARATGLIPLMESQGGFDWAGWAPFAHLEAEKEMIEFAKREDSRHAIPKSLVDAAIAESPTMEEEQKIAAIASCLSNKAVVVTEGTAGAGKSFTLEAIKKVYERAPGSGSEAPGYDIVGTALSWTAAKVLQESAKLSQAVALSGLLLSMDQAKENGGSFFKRRTLVIVDEAGLVGTMKMRALLRHAATAPYPVRVLLTGDSLQLTPVEAGNALEAIVDECGSSRLNVIRRQERISHRAAVKHFSAGKAEQGLWTYWQQEALWLSAGADERRELIMRDYARICAAHPLDACLVLALDNSEVRKLNDSIRDRLKSVGLLAGEEHELTVNDGVGPYKAKFCVGDRVVLRKNLRELPVCESKYAAVHEGAQAALSMGQKQDSSGFFSKMLAGLASGRSEPMGKEIRKGVFNRGGGIVIGIRRSQGGSGHRILRVLLSEGGEVEIDTAALVDPASPLETSGIALHHNFASTIYASQGQTVARVLLMDSPYMNRRLAYVGMSRHKVSCDVYGDAAELAARRRKRAEFIKGKTKAFNKASLAKLDNIINATSFDDGDLWAEAALAWNKESNNPTVLQAIKRLQDQNEAKRREQAGSKGSGRLRPAEKDDCDDSAEPPPLRPKPRSYTSLASEAALRSPAKKTGILRGFFGPAKGDAQPQLPLAAPEDEESLDLPEWTSSDLAAPAIAQLEGLAWGRSRWGAPRLFSLDPEGQRVARWTFDGVCRAGRSEIPVLPNVPESPWLIVAGAREAMISWSHFKNKHAATPEKAPSIAIAFDSVDLTSISEWIKPGAKVYCAWSRRLPESLEWARGMAATMQSMGYSTTLFPKLAENEAIPASGSPSPKG